MLSNRTRIWSFAALPALVLAAAIGARPLSSSRQVHPVGVQAEAATGVADVPLRHIVDARLKPYAALGRFEGAMGCTAAIVLDPRIIITAGHCITERDGSIRKSHLSFRLGYQAGTELGRFAATVWAIGAKQSFKQQSVHDASRDWVILVLDRAPMGVEPLVLGHHSFDTLKPRERQFLMPSYSHDIGSAEFISVDPACSVRDLAWHVLVHDCRGSFGSSGAPLLIQDRMQHVVVGIHTGSMFASDDAGHAIRFVGNRAVGAWMLAEPLLTLSRQLAGTTPHVEGFPAY